MTPTRLTLILITLVLTGALMDRIMRSTRVAVKRDAAPAEQGQPTLNSSFGFPVWLYLAPSNESEPPGRAIFIYLFIEPQHFNETDLKGVFTGLAAEYPPPAPLFITACTDRELLKRRIEIHLAGMETCFFHGDSPEGEKQAESAKDNFPLDAGCFLANYVRMEGREEAFEYNPDPHKVDRLKVVFKKRPSPYTGEINSDLLLAASEGDLDRAKELLEKGAEIETKDRDGNTVLMTAAMGAYHGNGQTQVARMLLDRGADVNSTNGDGLTALLYAAAADEPDLVRALISRGADVNARNRYRTPLMLSAASGWLQNVKILLASGAFLNTRDDQGRTALIRATENGHVEIVRALIQEGADVNVTSNMGETALGYAMEHDLNEIVRLLKHAGGRG